MIPGYVRERKCVKLCSLSFSLFKKIKFKMAKILSTTMGFFADFVHFQVSSQKMLEHKRGKKSSHRQVFCKKRVGISAGFYCIWFGISRQRTLRPWRKSTGFSGDFKEGTMQHSQELHAKESWSSNITQEHPASLGALQAGKERKNHPTTQAVTWHWTLLNCTLRTRISAYSETGGMSRRGRAW